MREQGGHEEGEPVPGSYTIPGINSTVTCRKHEKKLKATFFVLKEKECIKLHSVLYGPLYHFVLNVFHCIKVIILSS